ncbi:9490_t:CDS:2 [Paraglomus brasilianum]|uniref:DASH complex subunit DAD2 n=1 Tax=Paraglomus brasilianum TaxID=144538 RepID=A0A9N9B5P1_9GLOM|nr:9490_t:CDS:2 [Paraglomus brasilianum]
MSTAMNNPQTVKLLAKLHEKEREHENLLLIKETSGQMITYFEELALKLDELNEGCVAVSTILRNWQAIFRVISQSEPQETTLVRWSGATKKDAPQ